jgi:hypothetical protein
MNAAVGQKPHKLRTETAAFRSTRHHQTNDIKTFAFCGRACGQGAAEGQKAGPVFFPRSGKTFRFRAQERAFDHRRARPPRKPHGRDGGMAFSDRTKGLFFKRTATRVIEAAVERMITGAGSQAQKSETIQWPLKREI